MINLFIVDDHEIIREGLKRIFGAEPDMNVVGEANNGDDVLKGVLQTECNVLLLDLNIPGRDGAELIKEVKKKRPKVQILIISINPEDKYVLPLLRAGASGYICKNSDLSELVFAIRKIHASGRYVSSCLSELLVYDVLTEDLETIQRLTNLEKNILLYISKGVDYTEISNELSISISSISQYRRRILEKLNLKNNVQLVHYSLKNNLINII
ncbi:MAG: response regulator [Paludibacter sp.]